MAMTRYLSEPDITQALACLDKAGCPEGIINRAALVLSQHERMLGLLRAHRSDAEVAAFLAQFEPRT